MCRDAVHYTFLKKSLVILIFLARIDGNEPHGTTQALSVKSSSRARAGETGSVFDVYVIEVGK